MAQPLPHRLTIDDVDSIYSPGNVNRYNPGNTVVQRIPGRPLRDSHVVECNEFDRVFVTSDIHADFRKFVQILLQNYLLHDEGIDPYNGDDIYRSELIANARWTGGNRTLFVVVGDLVDGQRGAPNKIPDDSRGSFEFLVHALLYNLRLSAREQHSEVLFTIGNHDQYTVINIEPPRKLDYNLYVAPNAQRFFGAVPYVSDGSIIRQSALLPFYRISPYYILSLENGGTKEVAFVHGGLHTSLGNSNIANLISVQALIRMNITNLETSVGRQCAYDTMYTAIGRDDPLWTRYYTDHAAGTCDQVRDSEYRLIVVGHCPTNSTLRTRELKRSKVDAAGNQKYEHCDVGDRPMIIDPVTGQQRRRFETIYEIGCVMTDCEEEHTMLAFVDVAMSQGQRTPTTPTWQAINNRDRGVQMLVLTHRAGLNDPYYGNIDSIDNGILNNLHKSPEEAAANAQRGAVVPSPPAAGGAGGAGGLLANLNNNAWNNNNSGLVFNNTAGGGEFGQPMPGGYRRRRNKQTRKITRKLSRKLSRKKRLHRKNTHRRR